MPETFSGGNQQFARGNMMAMLRKWVGATSGVYVNAGAPVDGVAGTGTFATFAQKGAVIVDKTNGNLYINQGTQASPVWALIGAGTTVAGLGTMNVARATYDFAVNGGAISAIGLGVTIPNNAVVIGGFYDVITTCTSAADTGTGALSVNSANDIVTAVAIGTGTPFDAGLRAIIPKSNTPETTGIKLTAAREITFTIAVQAFTAGKFEVFLHYVQSS